MCIRDSSSALRTAGEKPHPLFDRFVGAYEKVLRWSLSHKAPVLCAALALLVFSGVMVTRMGTAFIPAMDSPQMSATLTMPKEADTRQTYEMADEVLARMCAVDGVQTVGAMEGGGMMGMGGSSSGHSISFYILLDDGRKVSNVEVKDAILAATADLDAEVSVAESTMDLSMLGGSGVELVVSGQDLDRMNEAAEDLRAILRGTEGLIDVSEAAGTDTPETRVTSDKEDVYKRQHWFSPRTGTGSGKHDSFIDGVKEGEPITRFSGRMLAKGCLLYTSCGTGPTA